MSLEGKELDRTVRLELELQAARAEIRSLRELIATLQPVEQEIRDAWHASEAERLRERGPA